MPKFAIIHSDIEMFREHVLGGQWNLLLVMESLGCPTVGEEKLRAVNDYMTFEGGGPIS